VDIEEEVVELEEDEVEAELEATLLDEDVVGVLPPPRVKTILHKQTRALIEATVNEVDKVLLPLSRPLKTQPGSLEVSPISGAVAEVMASEVALTAEEAKEILGVSSEE
jgi:hypothetical protein